jgi:hypothetical protein
LGLLATALAAGAALYLYPPLSNCEAQDLPKSAGGKRELFHGWGKPDLALMLTGQMHGYLQPCGCSSPQYGGLARRFNFLQSLKDRDWPVVSVDLGDLAQRNSPQAMLKYVTAMQALQTLGYAAIAVGKNELDMPLIDALSNYTLNNPVPRVLAANLRDADGQLYQDLVAGFEIGGKDGGPKVGVVGLIGPSVADRVKDPSIKFAPSGAALEKAFRQIQSKKADLTVLLYQGSLKEGRAAAEFWAGRQKANPDLPPIHIIQCLSDEEEPPSVPERAGNSLLVTVGHKGRYVGVVGAFRSAKAGQPFDLRYQLVSIGPEYETAEGKEKSNPVNGVMENYTELLKKDDFLARFPRTAHTVQIHFPNAKYVGSERCADCHEHAYKVWEKSRHATAYKSVAEARHPSLRQFDGECIVCHVVGFSHPTGFGDKANSKGRNEALKNVGCESCHGPASGHVNNPNNKAIQAALNPWKSGQTAGQAQRLGVDLFCQKCHDVDNDVHWNFDKNWPKIAHPTPKKQAQDK